MYLKTMIPHCNSKNLYLFLQELVREVQELLDKQDGVTPVHNRFYELSSNYFKLMGNHAEYYRDALRFLGCTELSDIPGKKESVPFSSF